MRKSLAVAAVVVVGAASVAGVVQAARGRAAADEVRLAVLRQQVAFWLDENSRAGKTVVCLGTEADGVRRSVTNEYLRHFAGETAVRAQADCEEQAAGAIERSSGRPAILVTAGEVAWQSTGEAWVATRHYRSGVMSGVQTLRVVREPAGWVCLGQILKDGPL